MIRKLVPLIVLVTLVGVSSLTATGIVGVSAALAVPCNPDVDPDCDPGGGETVTLINTDLDIAPPGVGQVVDDGAQIACGADCHGDYQYTRTCADFDCTDSDVDTVTLSGSGGPTGYSTHFSSCPANVAGTGCSGGPVTDCGIGNCAIAMDDDYYATVSWVDTTAPATAFSSPPTRVGPTNSTFSALGTDNSGGGSPNDGIKEVRFFVDDALRLTDTSAPYQYQVAVGDFTQGQSVNIKAQAVDLADNITPNDARASHQFTIDRMAGVSVSPAGGTGHFQTPPAIGFSPDDDVDDPADVTCRTLNPASAEVHTQTSCASPYTPVLPPGSPDGTYTVRVDVVDDVGNLGQGSTTFVRDDSDPNLTVDTPPQNGRVKSPFTPTYSVSDGLTPQGEIGVTCAIDSGSSGSCGSLQAPDGERTLHVRAVDKAGNERVVDRPFTADSTGPLVNITAGPADGAIVGTSNVTYAWTASDGSTPLQHRCKVDSGAFGACSSNGTHTMNGLAEGAHSFALQVIDNLGNVRQVERDLFVNAVRPSAAITSGPGEGDVVKSRGVTFGFATRGGAVSCSLDSESAFGPCSSGGSHTLSGLADGGHTFRVRVVDESGDTVVKSRTFRVDTSPPIVVDPPLRPILNPSLSTIFDAFKGYTVYKRLVVKRVPLGATVTVTCKGKKCPAKRFRKTRSGNVKLTKFVKRKLRAGTTLTISVTRAGAIGKRFVIKIRKAKPPKLTIKQIP